MKSLIAAVVVLVVGLVALTPAEAATNTQPRHSSGYTAPRYYYTSDATAAISAASARWGVSYWWLLRVAQCESGLNSGA